MSLRLPWIGNESVKFRREFQLAVGSAFPGISSRVIFTSTPAFSGRAKDVLPATDKSLLVYEYECSCARTYVGRTIQRLSERIKQHIPDTLLLESPDLAKSRSDSALTRHLKDSSSCISKDMRNRFKILASARSEPHLHVLEALFISRLSPSLCCQKDFVRSLSLF